MFIVALFTIAKTWKQNKFNVDRQMRKENVVYTYSGIPFKLQK